MAPRLATLDKGRYEQSADISDIRNTSYVDKKDLQTYIVEDTKDSRYRTLRLVRHGSRQHETLVKHLKALDKLKIKAPHPHILVPVDQFDVKQGKENYLAVVYDELLGPDLDAMENTWGDPMHFHEPEMIRSLGRGMAQALKFLHDKGVIAGLSTVSPVLTYLNLSGADEKTIHQFYDFPAGPVQFNESCTGPSESPFNKAALCYKLNCIDTTAAWSKNHVPETAFGESVGTKSDLWMLGSILFNLAAQTPEGIYGITGWTSQKTRAAIEGLPPSRIKGILSTIDMVGDLPKKYRSKVPKDVGPLIDDRILKYKPDAMYDTLRTNLFIAKTPKEKLPSNEEVEKLADLLKQMLAHDQEKRIDAAQVLESDYLQIA